jgi:hypothetical protein
MKEEAQPVMSTWVAILMLFVVAVLLITAVVIFWKYILFVIVFFGLLPVLRIFWGGASFFARH